MPESNSVFYSFIQSPDETKGGVQLLCVLPYSDLLWNDVSLSHMDIDGVQRGWQEQVLALTVEGQTLQTNYMDNGQTGRTIRLIVYETITCLT